jgi:chemotaxis protein MotB
MKRKKNINNSNDKTPNKDRYLITYADLLTLLFALFIILYSISRPDMEKMQNIFRAMNNVFNPNQVIDGNNLSPDVSSAETPPTILFPSQPKSIPEMQIEVENSLSQLIRNNEIIFQKVPEGIKLLIPNKFLFQSARATLLSQSSRMLDTIAVVIGKLDMQIQVDGHTDAVPIKSFTYSSNWELSAARAVSVVRGLIQRGVPSTNLVVRAFGEQRPIADNTTDEGKEKNRRVEIIIVPKDVNVATIDTANIIINK